MKLGGFYSPDIQLQRRYFFGGTMNFRFKWLSAFIFVFFSFQSHFSFAQGLSSEASKAEAQVVIEKILSSVKTGSIGDGKIFVIPIDKICRIRTGETDNDAI